jgi:hypothetical protein
MTEPDWAHIGYERIDYQSISYYSAPKSKDDAPKSLGATTPETTTRRRWKPRCAAALPARTAYSIQASASSTSAGSVIDFPFAWSIHTGAS